MKLNLSKDWFMKRIPTEEGDSIEDSIEAGSPHWNDEQLLQLIKDSNQLRCRVVELRLELRDWKRAAVLFFLIAAWLVISRM